MAFNHAGDVFNRVIMACASEISATAGGITAREPAEMLSAWATRAVGGAVYLSVVPIAGIFTAADMLAAAGQNLFGGIIGISPIIQAIWPQLITA
jgi:hypothetical protein